MASLTIYFLAITVFLILELTSINAVNTNFIETGLPTNTYWSSTGNYPLPGGDEFLSCVPTNGYVYCIGGVNSIVTYNAVYYAQLLPTGVGAWSSTGNYPLPNGVQEYSCVPTNGYVYCIG